LGDGLKGWAVWFVVFDARDEEQLALTAVMRALTVALSDTSRTVVGFDELFDENAVVVSAPPGRVELLASPYCHIHN